MALRIGIDVGGTSTDAVILGDREVVARIKQPTSENVTDDIIAALRAILRGSGPARGDVEAVIVGTTHFTNALVPRSGLARTLAVRLGLPATQSIPPLTDCPADLRAARLSTVPCPASTAATG